MPSYGFRCRKCNITFEVLIKTFAQANCKNAIPNMKMAVCPGCLNIVDERDYSGTKLNKRFIKSWESVVSLLGRPSYDPVFERLSVDGGRDDRKVFIGGSVEQSDKEKKAIDVNKLYFVDNQCNCEFCSPKEKTLTDGEKRQIEFDRNTADVMMRGSLSGIGLNKNDTYARKTREQQAAFQQFLSDPEPSLPEDEHGND